MSISSLKRTWRYKVRPIRVDGEVAYVPLTRGKVAVIDAADAALVGEWNWCAMPADGGKWYAYRSGIKKARLQQFLMPAPTGFVTDHRDRDGLNCRRSNLRYATPTQNSQNRARPRIGSGDFKGVSVHGAGRWRARIVIERQRRNLGVFPSAELAAHAYDDTAYSAFGEFAVLNFPDKFAPLTPAEMAKDAKGNYELAIEELRKR